MHKKLQEVNVEAVFSRIKQLAFFARSVLHLPFPDLERVNPSFGVIAKTCELIALILDETREAGAECAYARGLAETMSDIATAIVERDDRSIIDSMAILDEFNEQVRHLQPGKWNSADLRIVKPGNPETTDDEDK
ncbi:hypothetical protein [Shewanella algae]|uniref:hypothetical protein n=1 Tax=Shewanella algae TaxID=38313 RepID=UPI0031F529BA